MKTFSCSKKLSMELQLLIKSKMLQILFLAFKLSNIVNELYSLFLKSQILYYVLYHANNVKMPTIVGIEHL